MIKNCDECSRPFKPQAPRVRRCRPCVEAAKITVPARMSSENRRRALLAYHRVKRELAERYDAK